MLITAAVFALLALVAFLEGYVGLGLGSLAFSQSFFYVYVFLAVLSSVLHVKRRPKLR